LTWRIITSKSAAAPNIDRIFAVLMDKEYARWSAMYAGNEYFYGEDAGPVARRAVRYHHPLRQCGSTPTALDLGCGEGQDLAFLAECGYAATGVDFIENALGKARRLLQQRSLQAHIFQADLREWKAEHDYHLVLACNSLQFLGSDAPMMIERARDLTAIGGVLGLSLFACEGNEEVRDGVYFTSLEKLLGRFNCDGADRHWQMLETARLWQWNRAANAPQPFVTLIAQRLK
jgi:tellurite methyltransferase